MRDLQNIVNKLSNCARDLCDEGVDATNPDDLSQCVIHLTFAVRYLRDYIKSTKDVLRAGGEFIPEPAPDHGGGLTSPIVEVGEGDSG